jgi:hypothetical protein
MAKNVPMIRTISCPSCGAKIGEQCTNKRGEKIRAHRGRRDALELRRSIRRDTQALAVRKQPVEDVQARLRGEFVARAVRGGTPEPTSRVGEVADPAE